MDANKRTIEVFTAGCPVYSKALIQVKTVALAPIEKASVTTTINVKPGLVRSVRRL